MTYSKDGVWFVSDPFSYAKLHEAGYAMGGYVDDNGKDRYVLYRIDRQTLDKVHDFETLQELQLMAKLLIEGGM
jgi:hypothetical protein